MMEKFVSVFKNARVRYEYDELSNVHTLEFTPKSVYESEKFVNWEADTFDEFVNKYPCENICFISEDDLVGIENETYSRCGVDYYTSEEISVSDIGKTTIKTILCDVPKIDTINTISENENQVVIFEGYIDIEGMNNYKFAA